MTPFADEIDVTGRLADENIEDHDHDDPVGEHTHDGDTQTHAR